MHREIVQAFGHHRESGGDQLDDSALHEGRELALTFNFSADRLSPLYDLAGHPQVPFTFRREIAGDGVRIRLLDLALAPRGAEITQDRTRVVKGTSVSVRVDLGGRSIIKKKTRQ